MKSGEVTLGMRVRVSIKDRGAYARGAAEALHGKAGVVEGRASNPASAEFLVRFDTPARPWHANARPMGAFHFEACDLEPEPKA